MEKFRTTIKNRAVKRLSKILPEADQTIDLSGVDKLYILDPAKIFYIENLTEQGLDILREFADQDRLGNTVLTNDKIKINPDEWETGAGEYDVDYLHKTIDFMRSVDKIIEVQSGEHYPIVVSNLHFRVCIAPRRR